jgi:hypothetical protein
LKIDTKYDDVKLSAPSITKATVEYEQPLNAIQTAKKAEIKVDKANQVISSVVSITQNNTSKISEKTQDINSINTKLQTQGGYNLIKDSTLRLNYDKNIKTGTVTVEQNKEVSDNTISKSAIKINTGSVKFEPFKITENQDYIFSCKIYKLELTNVTIKITSSKVETYNIVAEDEKFVEFEFIINSATNQVLIELISDNNYAMFSDCICNKGRDKLVYQPFIGEIISENYKFSYNGLEIESSAKNTKSIFDSDGTRIINKSTGKVKADFNGDNTTLDRVTVQERINIGQNCLNQGF